MSPFFRLLGGFLLDDIAGNVTARLSAILGVLGHRGHRQNVRLEKSQVADPKSSKRLGWSTVGLGSVAPTPGSMGAASVKLLPAVAGAGAYWAGTLVLLSRQSPGTDVLSPLWSQVVAITTLAIFFAAGRRAQPKALYGGLVVTAMVASAAYVVLGQHGVGAAAEVHQTLLLLASGVSGSALSLLWGLGFACLDKRDAGVAVAVAIATCLLMRGVLMLLPGDIDVLLAHIVRTISPLAFVPGGSLPQNRDRKPRPDMEHGVVRFCGLRAYVGFVLSLLAYVVPSAVVSPQATSTGWALAWIAVGVGVVAVWRRGRADVRLPSLISAMPVTAFLLLLMPLSSLEVSLGDGVALCATPILWFSWTILSSIQNSEIKEVLGMSELMVVMLDKGMKNLFWVGGYLMALVVGSTLDNGWPAATGGVLFGLVGAWLVISTAMLARLFAIKERGRAIEEAASPEEQLRERCAAIARDFALSPREGEMLLLIAQGHTQGFVGEYYGVSLGTVKSHVAHIYQKTCVHNREQLFSLIDSYKVDLSIKKRHEVQ